MVSFKGKKAFSVRFIKSQDIPCIYTFLVWKLTNKFTVTEVYPSYGIMFIYC